MNSSGYSPDTSDVSKQTNVQIKLMILIITSTFIIQI